MNRELKTRIEQLLNQLQSDDLVQRLDTPRAREQVERWLHYMERWLSDGMYWSPSEESRRSTWHRLDRLESKVDEILCRPARCNISSELGLQFPNFMTSLTAINKGDLSIARTRFKAHQSTWLSGAERCVIADPYIFHPGSETASEYAEGIAATIGVTANRIDFYFSAAKERYKPSVAALVHTKLMDNYQGALVARQFTFYDCHDMHDRVWLHHSSIADDPPYTGWNARVMGASVNGVHKRPTYVVDMDDADANDYAKYLKNIRDSLGLAAIPQLPPP